MTGALLLHVPSIATVSTVSTISTISPVPSAWGRVLRVTGAAIVVRRSIWVAVVVASVTLPLLSFIALSIEHAARDR